MSTPREPITLANLATATPSAERDRVLREYRATNPPPASEAVRIAVSPPAPGCVACRVCGINDGAERAQVDLHLACAEKATAQYKRRAAARTGRTWKPPAPAAPAPLTRAELIARLAADRAARELDPKPARRGRQPKADRDRVQEDDREPEGTLFADAQLDTHANVGVLEGHLSTDGLG